MQAMQGSMAAMDDGSGVVLPPWWMATGLTPRGAYGPKTAASLAVSYTNLANPGTNNAGLGTAPTWDATNGWKFSRPAGQFLTTGIVPTATTSIIVRYSNAELADNPIFGKVDLAAGYKRRFGFFPRFSGTTRLFYSGSGVSAVGPAKESGVVAICALNLYFDGVQVGTGGSAWTDSDAFDIYFGKMNQYGGQTSVYIQCALIFDETISSAQVALATTAMAAL